MSNDTLTTAEMDALRDLGWKIGGGGLFDGVVKVGGVRAGEKVLRTRAEWRELLRVSLPTNLDATPTPIEETQEYRRALLMQRYVEKVEELELTRAALDATTAKLNACLAAIRAWADMSKHPPEDCDECEELYRVAGF